MTASSPYISAILFVICCLPSVAATDNAKDIPVLLPPFVVEEQRTSSAFSRLDWLYYKSDGLEILSACPQDETEQFIRNLRIQRSAISQFVADDLLFRTTLPTTLILFPKTEKTSIDLQMVKDVGNIHGVSNGTGHFSPMDDLRLSDPDSSYIFVVLDDWQWGWDIRHGFPRGQQSSLFYSPAYLKYLLSSRIPSLPDWFVSGMVGLYENTLAGKSPNVGAGLGASVQTSATETPWENSRFQMDPWVSTSSAAALQISSMAPRVLLPMRELLVSQIRSGHSEAYRRIWNAQAELFVRWAYSDRIKDGRLKLQTLAKAASTQPMSEELFLNCFGRKYSDARDELSDFLPIAVSKSQPFPLSGEQMVTELVSVRTATPAEIHRINGEWARRTLGFVQANYPAGMPLYIERARSVLQGAYRSGERDPQLLSSLALFRLDIGEADDARNIISGNHFVTAARPLLRLDLARLAFTDAVAHPSGSAGNISEEQAKDVLNLLEQESDVFPPLESTYVLAGRVLLHLGRDPTESERTYLNSGAALFPRNWQLLIQCISWDIRARDFDLARRLILLGEYEVADESVLKRFGILESLLPKSVDH